MCKCPNYEISSPVNVFRYPTAKFLNLNIKGYLILNLNTKKFHVTRNVTFRESIFPIERHIDLKNDKTKSIDNKT